MATIDFKSITNGIRSQFAKIKANNAKYDELTFSVDDEQAFLKDNSLDEYASIFIVLHYGEASTSLGSVALEISYTVLGTANEISLARDFLTDYATTYNLQKVNGTNYQLVVNTPNVSSDFNETGNNYRSLYAMQGILVGGQGIVNIESLTFTDSDGNGEEIPLLSFQDTTTNNLAPQVYGDSNGRTRSYTVSQTYTFTISTYSVANNLITAINKARYEDDSLENSTYKFTLKMSDGSGFTDWEFHLVQATSTHSLGNIPAIGLTFSL